MVYAANLLRNSDNDILTISLKSGYTSMSHFVATFKKYYGLSPPAFGSSTPTWRTGNNQGPCRSHGGRGLGFNFYWFSGAIRTSRPASSKADFCSGRSFASVIKTSTLSSPSTTAKLSFPIFSLSHSKITCCPMRSKCRLTSA